MTRSKQSWLPPSEVERAGRACRPCVTRGSSTRRVSPPSITSSGLPPILCGTPVGAINFIDADREFIKAEIWDQRPANVSSARWKGPTAVHLPADTSTKHGV